ncbi:MAG: hypothetical protein ABIV51_08160, partial [Saprospiraceae bacterium]
MRARLTIITIILLALNISLSAQKTYLFALISDSGGNKYQMYDIDFFAGNPTLYFTIDEDRFTHSGMTGFSNNISGYDFNLDQTIVYFMETEGDLYKYTIATDQLEFLQDVIPETTPALIYFYTQILNVFFINDSLLYCSGLTYGYYNINTNIFTKIRQPIDHLISFTPYEQDLLSTEVTNYKGRYLYVSNSAKIMEMNLTDPDLNIELFNPGLSTGINHTDIISYQYQCDSTVLFIRGSLFGTTNPYGWYKFDLDSGTAIFSHNICDIPNAINIYNVRRYNEPSWEDCQLHIDLDLENNTVSGNNFIDDSLCLRSGVPISDADIVVRNDLVVDSISVHLKSANPGDYLSFVTGNYSLLGNGGSSVTIVNNGLSSNTDFENAVVGG